MAVSAIDTLMQIATPPRAIEPPAPGGGGDSGFAPALEKAYSPEKPREPAPRPAERDDDQIDAAAQETPDPGSSNGDRAEDADVKVEATTVDATPAKEGEPTDEESAEDEVEISEMASTVAAAGEAQAAAAAAAQAEKAAGELLAVTGDGDAAKELAAANEGEATEESAAASQGDAEDAAEKTAKLMEMLSGGEAEVAKAGDGRNSDEHDKAKKSKGAKGNAAEVGAQAKKAGGENTVKEPQAAEQPSVDVQTTTAKSSEIEASAEGETAETGSGDAKASKGDGVDRLKLPPAEQTAELAAAIDRHMAMLEPAAATGTEGAAANDGAAEAVGAATATEAGNGGATAPRTAATLERLAAASMRRGESSPTDGGPTIDRSRFIQRVEGAMKAAQQRDGRIQVRLAPPELGALRIELSVQNGAMTAKLETETPAARNALLDNLPVLRERLAEQNIRVEKFDVDVRRDSQGSGGNGGLPDQAGDRQDPGSQNRRGHNAAAQPKVAPAARAARTAATASDAGLDVRI